MDSINLLSLAYLGNVQYFTKLCTTDCVIDIHENYIKQSYRNRCDILSANGVIPLTVNIVKPSNKLKCKIKDVRIDYSKKWQHQHWLSLVSAYKSSPYFDYYSQMFEPFYSRRFDFLLDLDIELTQLCLKIINSDAAIKLTDSYIEIPSNSEPSPYNDMRNAISPKPRLQRAAPLFKAAPYYQVFSEKMPFASNLSIIDLIFCEGPNAISIIKAP